MRLEGKITLWKDAKGFGFIHPEDIAYRPVLCERSFFYQLRRPTIDALAVDQLAEETLKVDMRLKGSLHPPKRISFSPFSPPLATAVAAHFRLTSQSEDCGLWSMY